MRTHVDLFSGIGGFALACRWARVRTVAFAEIDDYANRVLRKHWPNVRNYGDVRDVPAIKSVWLVSGGVPCQPASVAGKRQGTADDRWLWPEALAAVERIRSAWVLFENPTGILSLDDGVEFERICVALEGQGYEVQPLVIPACGVGAPHRRDRVWIVAHNNDARFSHGTHPTFGDLSGPYRETTQAISVGSNGNPGTFTHGTFRSMAHSQSNGCHAKSDARGALRTSSQTESREPKLRRTSDAVSDSGIDEDVADAQSEQASRQRPGRFQSESSQYSQWRTEPDVGRVANGIPARVDRLRGLGNAIVPQVAYQLIKRMIGAEKELKQWTKPNEHGYNK